jgi:uncharacterized protein (TIGR02118 family)
VKAIALMKKKEGMSFEEFERHLLDTHVPFMRALPGLERWVVNLTVQGDDPAPYDAITEFWFPDKEAFERAMSSSEVQEALRDGDTFVAPPGPTILVASEHVVIAPDGTGEVPP